MTKLTQEERLERKRERRRQWGRENRKYLALKKRLAYHQNIEKEREKARKRYREQIEKDPDFNKKHHEKYKGLYRDKAKQTYREKRESVVAKVRLRDIRKRSPRGGTDMGIYRECEAEILSAISLEVVSNV